RFQHVADLRLLEGQAQRGVAVHGAFALEVADAVLVQDHAADGESGHGGSGFAVGPGAAYDGMSGFDLGGGRPPRRQPAMFLYTICPACQSGYDLPELMRGKKLRCKRCTKPFAVVAPARPNNLPPPQPFPKVAAPPPLPVAAVVADAEAPSEGPTYLNQPRVQLDRPLVRP